jgi:hypothetical protein
MATPAVEDRPAQPPDRLHLLLAERGSVILPEAGNGDGRVTLTDAMLAVAALAPCFALVRSSSWLGFAALAVVIPALMRTHVVMVRGRVVGAPSGAWAWLVAFASSTFRVGLFLDLAAVIHVASVILGGWLGVQFAEFYVEFYGAKAIGPWTPLASQRFFNSYWNYGAIAGYSLAIPLTLLALAYLFPRLLAVRDPI